MRRFKSFLLEKVEKKKKEEPKMNLVQVIGNKKSVKTDPKAHHWKAPPHDIPAYKKRTSEFGGMNFYSPGEM